MYQCGCGGRIRTNDLRVMRAAFFLLKNREKPEISTKNRIFLRQIIAYFCLFLSSFEAILPQIHPKIGDRRVLNIIRRAPPHDLRVLERTDKPPLKLKNLRVTTCECKTRRSCSTLHPRKVLIGDSAIIIMRSKWGIF